LHAKWILLDLRVWYIVCHCKWHVGTGLYSHTLLRSLMTYFRCLSDVWVECDISFFHCPQMRSCHDTNCENIIDKQC